jgi:hypothetical protein
MKVPWLPKKKIARYASSLIAKYQAVVQHPIAPPIPVENIIERVQAGNHNKAPRSGFGQK